MRRWLPFAALVAALAGYAVAGGNGVGSGGLNGFPASGSSSGGSVSFNTVTASFIDAGVVSVSSGATECAIGITATNSATFRAICLDRAGGLSASGPYLSQAGGAVTLSSTANMDLNTGSGNTLRLNAGAGGAVRIDGSQSIGSCTLVSGTPSTCTATVRSGSNCHCAPVGSTAAIAAGGCAVNLVGTTLTITGPNTVTTVMNYHCF